MSRRGALIGYWNVFYGTAHVVAPVVTLVALYRSDRARYVRWRNTFLWMLVPMLVGFWLYPLTPPRLLPTSFGFIDTRLAYFAMGTPSAISGRARFSHSAMPSMHCAFATWVGFVIWPRVRARWAGALVGSYPVVMIFAIVVTGNHYFLDAVGGWVALAVGYSMARWRDWGPWRRIPHPWFETSQRAP